jgi:leucyl-tRNA synthetase
VWDDAVARDEEIEIPVQVNGKVRGRITLPADASEDEIRAAALALPAVQTYLADSEVIKVVVANRRLVNVVVKPK